MSTQSLNVTLLDDDALINNIDLDGVDEIVEDTASASVSQTLPSGDYTVKISLLPLKHPKDCEGEDNKAKLKRSSYVLVNVNGKPTLLVAERIVVVQALLNNETNEPVARKITVRYNLRYRNTTEKVTAGAENEYSVRDYASLMQNCYMQANGLTPKQLAAKLKAGEVTSADLEAVLSDPESEFYCSITIKSESRDSADGTRTFENNTLVPRSITVLDSDTVAVLQSM